MSRQLYYEDFEVGQQLRSPESYTIDREKAVTFAREYDPQNQHVDDESAKESLFGKLIVSGWQTAAVTMRLKSEITLFHVPGGVVGMGLDYLRWPQPTMPGDSLYVVLTLLEKRLSKSMPTKGIVKYRAETFNQNDEKVLEMVAAVVMPRRETA